MAWAAALLVLELPCRDVSACGWSQPVIEELTLFEPAVLGKLASSALAYDPFSDEFHEDCEDCAKQQMLADWSSFLGNAVSQEQWQRVLFGKDPGELADFELRLETTVARAHVAKVKSALALVKLARQVEPLATLASASGSPYPLDVVGHLRASEPLLQTAFGAMNTTSDPFLKQRYAFQAIRLLFYRRSFAEVITFERSTRGVLHGPSVDLAWRVRYYMAGALARTGQRAAANLELARVCTQYPPLSAAAANDFRPMEETDWQETLRLATTLREKTELWSLVGLKVDAITAMREIFKLDPSSDLLALLAVRELARIEFEGSGEAKERLDALDARARAARHKAARSLEQLAAKIADTLGADRPWVMNLVVGHLAARRGDAATAKNRISRAVSAGPSDPAVMDQAWASSLIARASTYRISKAAETQFGEKATEAHPKFGRLDTLNGYLRGKLGDAYRKAGQRVEAAFLGAANANVSSDPAFSQAMITRASRPKTPFDRWLLAPWGPSVVPELRHRLAMLHVSREEYAAASRVFQTADAKSQPLGTDPFVIHFRDCHDCDHETYASSPWTHANFVARLDELERTARGSGESAAEAAMLLGNARYNMSWHGNARAVLTDDVKKAVAWYRRAFEKTNQRELKARAAFGAAKAELGALFDQQQKSPYGPSPDALPIPNTWFTVLRSFSDTAYHREVLAECSYYRNWRSRLPAPKKGGGSGGR